MLFWKKCIFFLLLYSCVPTTKPTSTSSGVTPSAVSIDRIATSGNLLVITGSGLQGFNEVAITDSSNSFEKKFKVTEVTPTRIVSENESTLSLPVNELLELVLSSASGQTIETVIPITFSLQPGSVSTAAIQPQAITATKFKGVAGNPPAGTVPEWDGISQFNFVYPAGGGGGGGGGSVTSVNRGLGILGSGIPITSAGTISVDVGTSGDPTVTKIPFFTHDDRLVISNPAELYFSDSAFPDRNFVIYNDQFFSIGRVATATDTPIDYLTIDETGTVAIGALGDWDALKVGGSTVCLNNGQNCGANGNVYGPGSSTINEVAIFSGTTGKNIAGGGKLIGNLVTGPAVAVAGNLAKLDATGKIISDSGIASANVPLMTTAALTGNMPILSGGNSKDLITANYQIPTAVCPNGLILKSDGINFTCMADLVGTGTVVGPSSPTVGNLSMFNSVSGTAIADSGLALANVVNMVPIIPPTINQLIVAAGSQYVQTSNIFSTDLVTMSAPTTASSTDLILTSAGVNKTAKVSTISINNVVTMATPTTNAAEVLISDAMGSRTAIGSGLAIANVPTMATNSTSANTPILSVTNTKALKAAPYTFPATACASGEILKSTGVNFTCQTDIGTGVTAGDVMGPAAATLTNLASFNLATGKSIADSGISSTNVVTMTANAASTDNLITSAGANKSIKDSGILSTNLLTMPTAAAAANTVLVTTGANKIAQGTTLLSTDIVTMTSNALLAGNVLTSAGTNKSAQDSGIIGANLVTATANFSVANRVAISAGGTRALTETGYTIPTGVCASGFGLVSNGANFDCSLNAVGDVSGPGVATSTNLASFSGTTGKIIQDSGILTANVPTMAANGTAGTLLQTAAASKAISATTINVSDVVTASANFGAANRVLLAGGTSRAATNTGWTVPTTACTSGYVLKSDGTNYVCSSGALGDVVGPSSSTDNAIPRFDLATGKIIQNSGVIIADTTNDITGPQNITVSGVATPTLRANGNTDNQQSGTLFLSQGDDYGFKIYYDATNTNDGLLFLERRNITETARMNIKNGGQVQIGTVPNSTAVGAASLLLVGPQGAGTGPHQEFVTAQDNFPTRQFLNWSHDSVWDCWDCYHDGAGWHNSNTSSAFRWSKTATDLILATVPTPTAGGTEAFNNAFSVNEAGPATFSQANNNTGPAPYTQVGGTITLSGPRGNQAQWRGLNAPGGNNDAASEMWNQNGGWGWQRAWQVQTASPPTVYFDGTITAANVINRSDSSLKDTIADVSDVRTSFIQLRPRTYRWKNKYLDGTVGSKDIRDHYGFIAQEVEAIYPSAVYTINGVKGIDYAELTSILTARIQQSLPPTAGINGQYLTSNGTGGSTWTNPTTGTVTGTGTDNRIMRWNGTTAAQDSGVTIDDSNNVSGLTTLSSGPGTFSNTTTAVTIENPIGNDSMAGGGMLLFRNSSINTGGNYNNYITMIADYDGDEGGAKTFASMGYEANNSFEIYNPNNTAVSLQTKGTGNVGIGISNPSHKLHVSGTLGVTGVTTLNVGANSYTFPTTRGTSGQALTTDGAGALSWSTGTVPNVVTNAGTSNDNAVAKFDLATGKIIQNSGVIIADTTNDITGPQNITVSGTAIPTLRADGNTDNQQAGTLFLSQGDAYGFKLAYMATNAIDGLQIIGRVNNTETARMTIMHNGNVGIGTAAPVQQLQTTGNVDFNNTFIGDVGHGAGYACLSKDDQVSTVQYGFCQGSTETLVNAGTGETIRLRINNVNVSSITSGGEAITGTLSASGDTTVGGTLSVTGAQTFTGNTALGGTLSVAGLASLNAGTTVYGNSAGTGSAPYTTVGGVININGPRGAQGMLRGLNAPAGNNDASTEMWNQNGGWGWQRAWKVDTNSPPSVSFNGPITAQSYANNSSRILKKNITPLRLDNSFMDKFQNINVVKYQWRDKPYIGRKLDDELTDTEKETKWHFGFVAEELSQLFPDLFEDGEKEVIDYNSNGIAEIKKVPIKSFTVTDVVAVLVKVAQEQQKAINALANGTTPALASTSIEKNQQMEKRIEALERKSVVQQLGPDLSFNQNRLYLRLEEGNGDLSENEKLKREVALLRKENQRIQRQLDAINTRLNPKVSSD